MDASESTTGGQEMNVRYVHESPLPGGGKQSSNILWEERFPVRAGTFPPAHPCMANAADFARFKARGYWANPFPEGDGITLDPQRGQSRDEVICDIRECFGWEVVPYFNDGTKELCDALNRI